MSLKLVICIVIAPFAITGTRWNGPKFFGLRDKPSTA
jgi:hypothetical protein